MPNRASKVMTSLKFLCGGYTDEADPDVMAQKIDAAVGHGIDAFLFDWYWYGNKPYLNGALERGFMAAQNVKQLKFALMWANHDWYNIHPAGLGRDQRIVFPGDVNKDVWNDMTDYIIEHYFQHPSYWFIDGKPVFQIYELFKLIAGLGGVENCRQALDDFRAKAQAAGFKGIHLSAIIWGVQILPGEKKCSNPAELLKMLAFDSVTSYVWVHHIGLKKFPMTDYAEVMERMVAMWPALAEKYRLPYFPNVTMGWDSSPRTVQSDAFIEVGYPFCSGMNNNTPERFGQALQYAKDYVQANLTDNKIITINAWNEWTEGSYLEPDNKNGMKYLEVIREVFSENSDRKILTRLQSDSTRKKHASDRRC